jgi:hypothetical protein
MLDRYTELRKILLEKIEDLQSYCSQRHKARVEQSLKELCSKLMENRFHLVILGQVKRIKADLHELQDSLEAL